jgi:hypothetical protein
MLKQIQVGDWLLEQYHDFIYVHNKKECICAAVANHHKYSAKNVPGNSHLVYTLDKLTYAGESVDGVAQKLRNLLDEERKAKYKYSERSDGRGIKEEWAYSGEKWISNIRNDKIFLTKYGKFRINEGGKEFDTLKDAQESFIRSSSMNYQLLVYTAGKNEHVFFIPFQFAHFGKMAKLAIELDGIYVCVLQDCNGLEIK